MLREPGDPRASPTANLPTPPRPHLAPGQALQEDGARRAEADWLVAVGDAAAAPALSVVGARVAVGLREGPAFMHLGPPGGRCPFPRPPRPPARQKAKMHLPPGQALPEDGLGHAVLLRVQAAGGAAVALAFLVHLTGLPHDLQSRARAPAPGAAAEPEGPSCGRLPRGPPAFQCCAPDSFTNWGGWTAGGGGVESGGRELTVGCVSLEPHGQRVN